MKTTIELPDSIVQRAKIIAAERKTTLRQLILQGLVQVMEDRPETARDRAKNLFAAMDEFPEFAASDRLKRDDANAR